MKGAKSRAIVLATLLVVTFFFSLPAFSVEDPWDVDVTGGTKGDEQNPALLNDGGSAVSDSSLTVVGGNPSLPAGSGPAPRSEWWQTTLVKLSYRLVVPLSPRVYVQKYRAR